MESSQVKPLSPWRTKEIQDGRHGNQPVFKTVVRRRLRRRGWVRFPCASAIRFNNLRQILDASFSPLQTSCFLRICASSDTVVTQGRPRKASAPERPGEINTAFATAI